MFEMFARIMQFFADQNNAGPIERLSDDELGTFVTHALDAIKRWQEEKQEIEFDRYPAARTTLQVLLKAHSDAAGDVGNAMKEDIRKRYN